MPINAPVRRAHCRGCDASIDVPVDVWGDLLVLFDDEHEHLTLGQVRHHGTSIAGVDARCSFALTSPTCERCHALVPVDIPLDLRHDVPCGACGTRFHVYPVPEWLQKLSPTAQQIYARDLGEAHGESGMQASIPQGTAPIVMSCPQCGGSLRLGSDVTRTLTCHYCTSDVYLPDDLWQRIHPAKTVKEFFVRFEGETVAARRARASREANEHNAHRGKP